MQKQEVKTEELLEIIKEMKQKYQMSNQGQEYEQEEFQNKMRKEIATLNQELNERIEEFQSQVNDNLDHLESKINTVANSNPQNL